MDLESFNLDQLKVLCYDKSQEYIALQRFIKQIEEEIQKRKDHDSSGKTVGS